MYMERLGPQLGENLSVLASQMHGNGSAVLQLAQHNNDGNVLATPYLPLWGESSNDQWISLTKLPVLRLALPYYVCVMMNLKT